MKRLIAFALLCCLLLCACGQPATPSEATTKNTTASTSTTQTPNPPAPEKVTLYLLTKTIYSDSGSVAYHYDENNNIQSYTLTDLENTVLYQVFFENKDANGMAGVIRTQWSGSTQSESLSLTYSSDGKVLEEKNVGSNYTGYQYAYDATGNLVEKREYYDGILETVVYYAYDGKVLTSAYCEDRGGEKVFECRIQNGLVMEKVFFDYESEYGYRYEYDKNNNLTKTTFYFEGEDTPRDQYIYEAVEVDASRAQYLLEQQRYLLDIV